MSSVPGLTSFSGISSRQSAFGLIMIKINIDKNMVIIKQYLLSNKMNT